MTDQDPDAQLTPDSSPPAAKRGPSRLPVPKKVSALPVAGPALRVQPSRERMKPAVAPGGKSPTPRVPSIAKRSVSGIAPPAAPEFGRKTGSYSDATASSAARKGSRVTSSNYGLNASTGTPLKKKPSIGSMQPTIPASPRLAKVPSNLQLDEPTKMATPKRRTSDINGATAPALNRKPSNSQLQSPSTTKKPSYGQLSRKLSSSVLKPSSNESPTPLRKSSSSSDLPRSPAKSPSRTAQAPSQPRKATRAPKPQPIGPSSPPKAPSGHRVASQSLRDTIAKAKAAHKAVAASKTVNEETEAPILSNDLNGFNFETSDPFHQDIFGEGGSTKVLKQRVKSARVEGRLNISNLQLKGIPQEVWKMYESSEEDLTTDDDGPKWYESVDLVRFVGADNEIEGTLSEELATQFGGLATIDMHNNLLSNLPTNFAELTELTVLNLSNNKLDNGVLDVIARISTLKDLKLAKNGLEGDLDPALSKLGNLENLELQDNKLTSLPESMGDLSQLRSLNISRNAVTSLPSALWACPLRELDASNNRLSDPLFDSIDRLDQLEVLDVRNNGLSSLESSPIVLSSLKQMLVSNNRLESLPSMAGWDSLVTLLADSNRLSSLHEDLFTVPRLRTLDVSVNDIKSLDPRLGTMDSLETIKFDGNPLVEIRLASISTPDLKKTLLGRLAPPTIAVHEPDDSDNESVVRYSESEAPKGLEVSRGGVLDLSSKDYYELPLELVETVNDSPTSVLLSRNKLPAIPTSVEHFSITLKSLDLSFNRLSPESYLAGRLTLPALTTLVLQNTGISSLSLLFEHLDAPRLDSLDVTANRITSVEGVRQAFGQLTTLLAADNAVTEIPVESVEGLRVLDLSGNSIGHLPPKLALIESLKELRVQGNLFRVPRWQILDKGTEAVMSWLRDKLTPEEGGDEESTVD